MNTEQWMDIALDAKLKANKLKDKSKDEIMEILNTEYKGMERFLIYIDTMNIEFEGNKAKDIMMLFFNYRLGKISDRYMDAKFQKIYLNYKK